MHRTRMNTMSDAARDRATSSATALARTRTIRAAALIVSASLLWPGAPARADDGNSSRAVASAAASALETGYVFPSKARVAAQLLRARAASGTYDTLNADALATALTNDLAGVLHDPHVRVRYSEPEIPADPMPGSTSAGPALQIPPATMMPSNGIPPGATTIVPGNAPPGATMILPGNSPGGAAITAAVPPQDAEAAAFDRKIGYGFADARHLPGNIGYIDVRAFPGDSPERDSVVDAMTATVAYSDAIVIDLRRNHGGTPTGVARLLSHFLPARTHLNDFLGRGDGNTAVRDSSYTVDVPGPAIAVPVFILTSHHTFSAGEECAYDLQALKRATIVGENTGGGANPGGDVRLTDHFRLFVPDGRARNPITMTNWDGTGVIPGIRVGADRALATAYQTALEAKAGDSTRSADDRSDARALAAKVAAMSDAEIFAL